MLKYTATMSVHLNVHLKELSDKSLSSTDSFIHSFIMEEEKLFLSHVHKTNDIRCRQIVSELLCLKCSVSPRHKDISSE